MSHPYKGKADKARNAKYLSITSNPYKEPGVSTSAMQHKDQAGAPGRKHGGRVPGDSAGGALKGMTNVSGGGGSGIGRLEEAKNYRKGTKFKDQN